jgi:hypothetical protein
MTEHPLVVELELDLAAGRVTEVCFGCAHIRGCFSVAEKLIVRHPSHAAAQFLHINWAGSSKAVHGHPDESLSPRLK